MDRCPNCGKWTPGIAGKFCTACFLGMGGVAPLNVLTEVQSAEFRCWAGTLKEEVLREELRKLEAQEEVSGD